MSSSSETYVNSDDGSISEEFHKHFWKYAIGGIIVMLIGLMAYKIISVLVNNPVTKAVNDLVGIAGLLLRDFTKGCCSQDDCPNISTKDECNSGCGCAWDDKGSKCSSTTGATVGSGGWNTFKCPFFLTAIVGLGAWLLVKIVGGIYSVFKDRQSNKDLAALERTTSKKTGDVMKEYRDAVDIATEKWEKGQEGKEVSPATRDYAMARISQITYNQTVIQKLKDAKSDVWKASEEYIRESRAATEKAAAEEDVDMEKQEKDIEDAAGKDTVPRE